MTAKARRGRGEGSVYYSKPLELWVGAISLGTDGEGKRIRRVVYAKSKKQVQQSLQDLRARTGLELKASSAIRFDAFAKDWIDRDVAHNRRETTHKYYEFLLNRYILPQLGKLRLTEVTPSDVERAVAIARELRSPSMAAKVRSAIGRILNRARRLGLIQTNAAAATDAPRVERKTMRFLEPAQVRRLLEAARSERLGALIVLLATGGLRIGEALALTWDDLNLDNGELRVEKTLIDSSGPLRVAEPKTNAGRRVVVLTQLAKDALQARYQSARDEGFARKRDPIFPTAAGTYQRRKNVADRLFKPLLAKAQLPEMRLHDLRHTSAALSVAAGASPRTVSERLGHADAGFTMRTYGHATNELQRKDANAIDKLLE